MELAHGIQSINNWAPKVNRLANIVREFPGSHPIGIDQQACLGFHHENIKIYAVFGFLKRIRTNRLFEPDELGVQPINGGVRRKSERWAYFSASCYPIPIESRLFVEGSPNFLATMHPGGQIFAINGPKLVVHLVFAPLSNFESGALYFWFN